MVDSSRVEPGVSVRFSKAKAAHIAAGVAPVFGTGLSMLALLLDWILIAAAGANAVSAAYMLLATFRVKRFRRRRVATGTFRPPVTILKPVCGLNAGLYENLKSFCIQDYPRYQVIFGVRDTADPAVPVLRRLRDELPEVDIAIVIDKTVTGPNLKVSNLENMRREARYDYLAIADSDMRVNDQYLASVVAPFEQSGVGVVTCLYSARSAGGIPSLLGCMFINEWFLPSVLASTALSRIRFGLRATIVVRRELLDGIGSFSRLSHFLADDHMLGKLVSRNGFRVVLSDYVVENVVYERSLASLFRHELRWARTVRTVEPLGHLFSFLMYGVPIAVLGAVAVELTFDWEYMETAVVALAVALRVWMHFAVSHRIGVAPGSRSVWLVPLRDVMSFVVWAASFFSRSVEWNNTKFRVGPDGFMRAEKGYEA
jgi:ceramide glucosyltransferase